MEAEPEPQQHVQTDATRCSLWLATRKRFCHMQRTRGSAFCAAHTASATKVPCPLDPHHSVEPWRLQSHLRKCPGTAIKCAPSLPSYALDANAGSGAEEEEDEGPAVLPWGLVGRLRAAHARCLAEVPVVDLPLRHPVCDAEDKGSAKHSEQHSSIVAHMQRAGLLECSSYIEFGAGRAKLSISVAMALAAASVHGRFWLIDRGRFKHKAERGTEDFERVLIDIKDFDASRVEGLAASPSVAAYGKHLCGAASDLSLRCMCSLAAGDGAGIAPKRFAGVVFAQCCFHKCSWRAYVNKRWVRDAGFSPAEFRALCNIVSWCTCAMDVTDERRPPENGGLTNAERAELGRMARHLLCAGRCLWLRDRGFDANLFTYVAPSVSLENMLLVATRRRDPPAPPAPSAPSAAPSDS
eukprot:m51a1_g7723 hypothetical protein (410) ;mRNA; r:148368-149845